MKPFFGALEDRVRSSGSILCVGLDPRCDSALEARSRCLSLIEATAPWAAAFKPNVAFFEALGPHGIEVLIEVVAAVPSEIPVILDAKRGDIASSAAFMDDSESIRKFAEVTTRSPSFNPASTS